MPDINSLPPSRSESGSPTPIGRHDLGLHNPSPRSSSVSLAAAASINAGMTQDTRRPSATSGRRGRGGSGSSPQSSRVERRSSTVVMNLNLNLNDPNLPGPGELQSNDPRAAALRTSSPQGIPPGWGPSMPSGDPHHQRAPSLGELHQELEQEQEAQVNRLLQMIRQQQHQLRQMQQATGQMPSESAATDVDDSTPTSERSFSFPATGTAAAATVTSARAPMELSRQSSRRSLTPSRTTSPALRPLSAGLGGHGDGSEQGWLLGGSSRHESDFYQAETQMLTRENQMLRLRIRELERQINDSNSTSAITSSPTLASNLTAPAASQEDEVGLEQPRANADGAKV